MQDITSTSSGGKYGVYHVPPSQLPLATSVTESGFRTITSTASTWPSRLAMNGFANMRSIFAAFSARVRSRARENGCILGSRLRWVGVGSPGRAGRCAEGACWRTDIFWEQNEEKEQDAHIEKKRLTTMVQVLAPVEYFLQISQRF